MIRFEFSLEFISDLKKVIKKDKVLSARFLSKLIEITSANIDEMDRYKNLRYGLKEYKRIHLHKSFVLVFHVDKNNRIVTFVKLKHHDQAYKK